MTKNLENRTEKEPFLPFDPKDIPLVLIELGYAYGAIKLGTHLFGGQSKGIDDLLPLYLIATGVGGFLIKNGYDKIVNSFSGYLRDNNL